MLLWRRTTYHLKELTLILALLFISAVLFFESPLASCAVKDVLKVSPASVNHPQVPDQQVSRPVLENNRVTSPISSIGTLEKPNSKYAFVCYLAPTEEEDAGKESKEDDVYITSVRMLIYQLLHDPETRTTTSIPFIVLVSPEVPQTKRQRLEREGAFLVEYPSIELDTLKPGRPRWKHVIDKLNVFKLTQFEKVLLLDSDIVIFKPLDAIFEQPETSIRTNLGKADQIKDDEGKQPQKYLLAADSSPLGGDKHPYPAERATNLNAGFMVLHPSEEMLQHYLKIASIEGRTPMVAPENQLLEYVHRAEGNLPWSKIQNTWVMNHPVYNDYAKGIAAVHEKWYRNSMQDIKLKEVLLRVRWKMDGYWLAKAND